MTKYIIFTDGSSRPLEKTASTSFIVKKQIENNKPQLILEQARFYKDKTNNQTELMAIRDSLDYLTKNDYLSSGDISLIINSDSSNAVNALNDKSILREERLKIIDKEIKNVVKNIKGINGTIEIKYKYISKNNNKDADKLSKQCVERRDDIDNVIEYNSNKDIHESKKHKYTREELINIYLGDSKGRYCGNFYDTYSEDENFQENQEDFNEQMFICNYYNNEPLLSSKGQDNSIDLEDVFK